MNRIQAGFLLLVLATGLAGCDSGPTAPGPQSGPPGQAPRQTGFAITGNQSLTAIGETSQMTATALFSDGTSKDVTSQALWYSSDPSSISVSPGGMLTVVRFGLSSIRAAPQTAAQTATIVVTATPPGTFVVSGRVREPGSGGLVNVRVLQPESGVSGMSLADGPYSLGGLTNAHLTFEKEGYEPTAIDAQPNGYDDVPLQRVIRVAPDGTFTTLIAPNDMDYRVAANTRCHPCRMIRVVGAEAGVLHAHLTWSETHSTLNVWVNGRSFAGAGPGPSEIVADVPVVAGEVLVYAGMSSPSGYYVPFTLTTTLTR